MKIISSFYEMATFLSLAASATDGSWGHILDQVNFEGIYEDA